MAGSSLEPLKPGGEGSVWYAYAYLTLLILGPIAALAVGVWTGLIDLDLTVTAEVALGTALTWLAQGVVVVFLLWTFIQLVRVTGIGFMRGLVSAAARIAHNYELPEEVPEVPESSGGEDEGEGE